MDEATIHHIKNNRHHPEFHTDQVEGILNTNDRDKPPEELVDGTKMPDLDIAEMCADWCAMAEELKNNPIKWADDNIGVRWRFDDEQTEWIYKILNKVWK